MARTKRTPIKATGGHDLEVMREEYNALVTEVEELRATVAALLAKLDADAGVTGTDYVATIPMVAVEAKLVGVK
jgi:hypothetical protein